MSVSILSRPSVLLASARVSHKERRILPYLLGKWELNFISQKSIALTTDSALRSN